VLTVVPTVFARAQAPAAPVAKTVSAIRDEASLFSTGAREKALGSLEKVEKELHVPVLIETVDSLSGESVSKAAIRTAMQWGHPGIVVYIPKKETKVEIRVYRTVESAVSAGAREKISNAFVSEFRKQQFDAGLLAGVTAIQDVLTEAAAEKRVPSAASAAQSAAGESHLIARDQIRLNLAGARLVHAAAEAKAKAMGLKVNIAVVDDGGHLITFTRMDGARPASAATAITKATTAATFRQATGPLPPGSNAPDVLLNLSLQNAAAASGGKITTLYGGVPIVVDGQVIGAVGVGGGSGEQDAEIAKAGVTALTDVIKGGADRS
jgi:glc operon protein GlcG